MKITQDHNTWSVHVVSLATPCSHRIQGGTCTPASAQGIAQHAIEACDSGFIAGGNCRSRFLHRARTARLPSAGIVKPRSAGGVNFPASHRYNGHCDDLRLSSHGAPSSLASVSNRNACCATDDRSLYLRLNSQCPKKSKSAARTRPTNRDLTTRRIQSNLFLHRS